MNFTRPTFKNVDLTLTAPLTTFAPSPAPPILLWPHPSPPLFSRLLCRSYFDRTPHFLCSLACSVNLTLTAPLTSFVLSPALSILLWPHPSLPLLSRLLCQSYFDRTPHLLCSLAYSANLTLTTPLTSFVLLPALPILLWPHPSPPLLSRLLCQSYFDRTPHLLCSLACSANLTLTAPLTSFVLLPALSILLWPHPSPPLLSCLLCQSYFDRTPHLLRSLACSVNLTLTAPLTSFVLSPALSILLWPHPSPPLLSRLLCQSLLISFLHLLVQSLK